MDYAGMGTLVGAKPPSGCTDTNYGDTTGSGGNDLQLATYIYGRSITLGAAGTAQSISVYFGFIYSGPGDFQCALYTNASGSPDALVAVTETINTNVASQYHTFDFATPPSVSATIYWAAIWGSKTIISSNSGRTFYDTNAWGGSWPDPMVEDVAAGTGETHDTYITVCI